jgi:predicted metalloprotease with PDZ domain
MSHTSQTLKPQVIVMSKISALLLAGLLVGAQALAAESAPAPSSEPSASADLNAQLVAARQKLEAAARDVARLSSQLGRAAMAQVRTMRTRAVLGLQVQTEPSPKQQGAIIMGVSPAGPAAEAGLVGGDIIVGLNGAPISGPNAPREVVEYMANVKPDTKISVKVLRDGKPKEFQVTARASYADFFTAFNGPGPVWIGAGPNGPRPPGPQVLEFRNGGDGGVFEGMELAELSPALGEYFGTSKGVLVVRVPHDGDFLKLQDGDVILSIDGRVPENGAHATRILRSYQPGEKVQLKIMRQKKSLDLEGTLPEQRQNFIYRRAPERGPGERPPADHPPTDQD